MTSTDAKAKFHQALRQKIYGIAMQLCEGVMKIVPNLSLQKHSKPILAGAVILLVIINIFIAGKWGPGVLYSRKKGDIIKHGDKMPGLRGIFSGGLSAITEKRVNLEPVINFKVKEPRG